MLIAERYSDDSPSTTYLRRKEIVIVDRDITWAATLRKALEAGNFGVRICADPTWARDAVEDKRTDLVIVSTSVGPDAISALLSFIRGRRRPPAALALLDASDRGDDAEWRLMGFASALRHPFEVEALSRAVTALLGKPFGDARED